MSKKRCPLLCDGWCDHPDILEEFPENFRENCAKNGCILRCVLVAGTRDDKTGIPLNLVRATDFNREYGYRDPKIPVARFRESIQAYVRGVQI